MGVPSPGATSGGPALHLPMLVEDLRADTRFEIVTFPFGRWTEGERLPLKIWHQALDLGRYTGLLRRTRPDLVHLNSCLDRRALLRDVPFTLLSRALGRRVFVKWHGSQTFLLEGRLSLWRLLAGVLLRSVSGLGVLSTAEVREVQRVFGWARCYVVKNALDLGRYERRAELRGKLDLPGDAPVLLFISRLIPGKGLLSVLRALPDVANRHGAQLVVVGDGPLRKRAEGLARELGLGPYVHFVGRVTEEQALDYYCGCDVLVFPTYLTEGFPMTLFQSVAAGLGIVTTCQRSSADYLREPENCLFVKPRDPEGLSRALVRLLGEPQLLAGMRRENRELARRFERREVAAEFGRIYAGLVDASRRGDA
jgi:glycosyltransferase involved in cell wall biosynthesis